MGRGRVTLMLLAGVILAVIWAGPSGGRATGLLPAEAYVWQRAWAGPVRKAIASRSGEFTKLVVLAAQVSWSEEGPNVHRVGIDFAALSDCHGSVGLAIRVSSVRGPLEPARGQVLAELVRSLLAEARGAGAPVAEVQIDFDAAESQLDGYRSWIETIRGRAGAAAVTITALPSWLDAAGFEPLAKSASPYVLQVHSFEPPALAEKMTLCDPARAKSAVERAGRVGVPFRVALPTYSYLAAFDRQGKFLGVSAEGSNPPPDAGLRLVRAEQTELAELVRSWTNDRPAAMQGIIWYRLPVEGDQLNWRWPTLAAVKAGRAPASDLRASIRNEPDGAMSIEFKNCGEADESLGAVRANARGGKIIAADGMQGFAAYWDAAGARFTPQGVQLLGAGDSRIIGWIRAQGNQEVELHVER